MSYCPKCWGTGKVAPVADADCVVCGGSGSRYSSPCRLCYGTGKHMMKAEKRGMFSLGGRVYDCPICGGSGHFDSDYEQRVEDLAKNRR